MLKFKRDWGSGTHQHLFYHPQTHYAGLQKQNSDIRTTGLTTLLAHTRWTITNTQTC